MSMFSVCTYTKQTFIQVAIASLKIVGKALDVRLSVRNYGGYYRSSTAYSSGNAYYLYLNSSSVYPGTDNILKYYGRTVRCVAPGV